MNDHPSCETCRFLRDFRNTSSRDIYLGNCLRHPPNRDYTGTWFPVVGAKDWCGEYQPIPRSPEGSPCS